MDGIQHSRATGAHTVPLKGGAVDEHGEPTVGRSDQPTLIFTSGTVRQAGGMHVLPAVPSPYSADRALLNLIMQL